MILFMGEPTNWILLVLSSGTAEQHFTTDGERLFAME